MAQAAPFSINRRISSTRHAVVRGPNLTGFGKRPSLIPAHQVDFDTGIGPSGARIFLSRRKPVSGSVACCAKVCLHPVVDEAVLQRIARIEDGKPVGFRAATWNPIRFRYPSSWPPIPILL